MDYPCTLGTGILPENRKEIFEEYPHEYMVMIGGGSPYGSRVGEMTYWNATAYYLGYIDLTTGERCEGRSLFTWILKDGEFEKGIHKQLFVEGEKYRIKGLPSKKSSGFYPLQVLGKVRRMPFLDALWKEYISPVFLHSDLFGEMELNKRYGYYHADFDWLGTKIKVSFNTDEGDDEGCLANLEAFCRDAERWDREMREYSADELTYLANEWRDDDHLDEEITEEDFKRRIVLSSIEVSCEGHFFAYFDDDDMFAGHTVHVSGDIENGCNYADLMG
ncbi:MAG: DUF2262 domain-containing protein [Ruminococcus sp.]|nr:DUF2262 domain-containing protein [Ruminococcus sp.]